jgi:uncharacterized SAM-binding protein YcdF (DUF218 family)
MVNPPSGSVNDSAEPSDRPESEAARTAKPTTNHTRYRRRRRRRLRWLVAVALVFVIWAAVTARMFVWPDLAPLPPRADAIIELAGPGIEGRDQLAIKLAREHKARFLVQSTVAAEAGTDRCLPAAPDVTVLCFHPDPNTTRGEAEWIGKEAERRNWKSVILVTTPDQAWRARLRVSRCFDGKVYSATSPLPLSNWFEQIPYQWFASTKAFTVERAC